jgi:hypothetical protein
MKHIAALVLVALSFACGSAVDAPDAEPGTVPARIEGTAPVDVAALDGQELSVMAHDSLGTTPFVTTFAAPTSCEDVAAQIQVSRNNTAPLARRIGARCEDGVLVLEAVEPGPAAEIGIVSGSALEALGLTGRTYISGS